MDHDQHTHGLSIQHSTYLLPALRASYVLAGKGTTAEGALSRHRGAEQQIFIFKITQQSLDKTRGLLRQVYCYYYYSSINSRNVPLWLFSCFLFIFVLVREEVA